MAARCPINRDKSSPDHEDSEEGALDPKAIARLNRLIEATGAKVVISSSWRYGRTVERLQELLTKRDFVGEVIDKTVDCVLHKELYVADERGHEIREWLNRHPEVKSFVVLDDDNDMATVADRHIKTSLFRGGLLDEHVDRAIEMLMEDFDNDESD
jgi:hypothetical protein